ncbi:TonB family protein [candidate division KSB1 bacterium]|nr:TonB family protein [candidate division KSB1 bacterium]
MTKVEKKLALTVQIKQPNGVFERILLSKEKFYIGHHSDNDWVVQNEHFGNRQLLFAFDTRRCFVYLTSYMHGEVRLGGSRLGLYDLCAQEVLPRQGDYYTLSIQPGSHGFVQVGDATIEFTFDEITYTHPLKADYTWFHDVRNSVSRDFFYKMVLTLLIAFEIIFSFSVSSLKFPPRQPMKMDKIPQRVARFISRPTPTPPGAIAVEGEGATGESGETAESGAKSSGEKSEGGVNRRSAPPMGGMGLLGLLGGSGEAEKSSAAVDFLIDRGLVQEMDELLGRKTLIKGPGLGRGSGSGVGNGSGSGSGDVIDDLQALGLAGGVDDIISSVQGVESVTMQKQGQVNIQPAGQIRGSEAARSKRSAVAVMGVINSQQARMMYVYNKYLRTNVDLRGKISVDITIEADGSVSSVAVVESSINHQDFIRDLLAIFRRLRFDPIQEGSVTVNLPLVFNRPEA